jgi:hypothetical protein
MINIIQIYVFYFSIKVWIYLIVLKNINILQIYLYNINIYFGLGSSEFRVGFINIHSLLIIYWIQKILIIKSGGVDIHHTRLICHP